LGIRADLFLLCRFLLRPTLALRLCDPLSSGC
jgi:hypothetical protein